jgi:dipeptidyl aminopeptidase/acylaminoacyl peptidase
VIISSEKFIPHSLEHLTRTRVFPTPLPEVFYDKICKEYEAVDYAVTQRIIYESDGLKVTGITSFPVKTEPGKHPILIYNRGGTREYGKLTVLSVMRAMIPFAKAGYLVYASNYRGNDGGEGTEEFGGADLNDVFNLLETAKANPAWDGRNIFMLGHSRGGLMTYMAIRNNKEINAAVSIAGVADIFQSAEERLDMQEKVYQKLIPGTGDERKQAYINRSALCWANEIDTPLLLMHGTSDDAVDVSHSLKLAEKLKEAGKTYEIIIYEGGSHALLRQWDDVLEKSLSWFENYKSPSPLQGENSLKPPSPFQGEYSSNSPSPSQGEGWGEGK